MGPSPPDQVHCMYTVSAGKWGGGEGRGITLQHGTTNPIKEPSSTYILDQQDQPSNSNHSPFVELSLLISHFQMVNR